MKAALVLGRLRARWCALHARQQTLIASAAIVVIIGFLWWLLIAPPLRTLSQADAQRRILDAQLQKMQGLQAQAQALISQPKINRDDAWRALEASVEEYLGPSAQIKIVGDRATVSLRNTPAEALSQWLTHARVNARAFPTDVRLTRNLSVADAPAKWDGVLVLALPAQ
ncbi:MULTISPECIES: type II secretion system protein GspM [unclassified Polaromonas]|uniref:type II secretion system protein GspM n=1 Tax=unclassified Polaromonas TaxID=2638319 RepID=UPI000F0774F4|nr:MULTISPECIES: type II secretion system protein GspM [unclassified Polaromonas]AYQ30281.1 type II secretion system protein M [Polaromonas sp. SP1]QGJ18601.1 type II secretion system protein M [Polaromonas sp. Pch-P]